MTEQPTQWSTLHLLLAAGSGLGLGLTLGYKLSSSGRAAPRKSRVPKLTYGARLAPVAATASSAGSADSTPAATPRCLSREDSARGEGLRMLLLVRTDAALTPKELAEQSARVVLGLFKKQFKRRDPNLRLWEEGGHRIRVVAVESQSEIMSKQLAARERAIATHTFAGNDRVNKMRTVMAIGPAPAEVMDEIVHTLQPLA